MKYMQTQLYSDEETLFVNEDAYIDAYRDIYRHPNGHPRPRSRSNSINSAHSAYSAYSTHSTHTHHNNHNRDHYNDSPGLNIKLYLLYGVVFFLFCTFSGFNIIVEDLILSKFYPIHAPPTVRVEYIQHISE